VEAPSETTTRSRRNERHMTVVTAAAPMPRVTRANVFWVTTSSTISAA
jgi:hypothetical protein